VSVWKSMEGPAVHLQITSRLSTLDNGGEHLKIDADIATLILCRSPVAIVLILTTVSVVSVWKNKQMWTKFLFNSHLRASSVSDVVHYRAAQATDESFETDTDIIRERNKPPVCVAASFPMSEGDKTSVSEMKTWSIWDAVGGSMLCNDL
jgi:hypothetical protein